MPNVLLAPVVSGADNQFFSDPQQTLSSSEIQPVLPVTNTVAGLSQVVQPEIVNVIPKDYVPIKEVDVIAPTIENIKNPNAPSTGNAGIMTMATSTSPSSNSGQIQTVQGGTSSDSNIEIKRAKPHLVMLGLTALAVFFGYKALK